MEFKELIEKHGIENISKKTKISVLNLQIIENQDYSSINRLKTIGFISIVEREYKISLEELKEKAKKYFSNNKIIVEKEDNKSENIFYKFKKYIIIFIVCYITYLIYTNNNFTFVKEILENNFNKTTNNLEIIMEENSINDTDLNENSNEYEINEKEINEEEVNEEEVNIIDEIDNNITIISNQKTIEVTFLNLSSKEEINQKIIKDSQFIFNSKNEDWIMKVNQGYFKIIKNSDVFENSEKNPIFFFLKQDIFKEISEEKFNELRDRE